MHGQAEKSPINRMSCAPVNTDKFAMSETTSNWSG